MGKSGMNVPSWRSTLASLAIGFIIPMLSLAAVLLPRSRLILR